MKHEKAIIIIDLRGQNEKWQKEREREKKS